MDRVINIKVCGNHLTKDNKYAGVKGEGNATNLRITFDDCWGGYAKTVTFYDALGGNSVKRNLTTDLLENIVESKRIYLVPIPPEALTEAGTMSFVIDGCSGEFVVGEDGNYQIDYNDKIKRQRSIEGVLEVKDASDTENPVDPTPNQIEQMQGQYEAILDEIQKVYANRNEAEAFAESAEQSAANAGQKADEAFNLAEAASASAESAEEFAIRAENTLGKASYIGENGNWYAWDSEKDEFYDTGFKAQSGSTVYYGENPPDEADVWIDPSGESEVYAPYIADNGNWYTYNVETEAFTDSGVLARGYTPIKNVDYYTDAEKKELIDGISEVLKDYTDNLAYYDNPNIKHTDENLFYFTLDDETMSARVEPHPDHYGEISGDLVIPHHYTEGDKTYTVTSSGCFSGWNEYTINITSVTIPNTVTVIEWEAFAGNESLATVKIPDSVEVISTDAFCDCFSLTEITLPKNLTTIGDSAFGGTGLKEIIIPDGVTTIDNYAFSYCDNLESIVIPVSVTTIGDGIFRRGNEEWITVYYNGTEEQWNAIEKSDEVFGYDMVQVVFLGSATKKYVDEHLSGFFPKTQKIYHNTVVTDTISIGSEIKFTFAGLNPNYQYDIEMFTNGEWINNFEFTTDSKGDYTHSFIIDADYFEEEINNIDNLMFEFLGYPNMEPVENPFIVEYTCYQKIADVLARHETDIKNLNPSPIKTIPDTLEANQKYNFGEVTKLNLAFPTTASDGDVIYLTFLSGAAATTLTIDTTNTCDIEVIPEANTGYEIFGMYNGSIWIINYSEYTVSEV